MIASLVPDAACLCAGICRLKISFEEPDGKDYSTDSDTEADTATFTFRSTPTSRDGAEKDLRSEEKENVRAISRYPKVCAITLHKAVEYCHVVPRALWKDPTIVRVPFPS
jgi:hypothetical protein